MQLGRGAAPLTVFGVVTDVLSQQELEDIAANYKRGRRFSGGSAECEAAGS